MNRRSLLAAMAGGIATPAIAAPPQPFRLLVAGQSLAKAWTEEEVAAAFRAAYGRPVEITVAAEGGTSMLPSRPRSWTQYQTAGPVLVDALRVIGGKTFDAVLWAQGQADADDYKGQPAKKWTDQFQRRTMYVLGILRGSRSVPVFVQTLGWTSAGLKEPRGWSLIRHAQTDMVGRHGRTMNLYLGPVQDPWTPLADRVHPTPGGYREIAQRAAEIMGGVT